MSKKKSKLKAGKVIKAPSQQSTPRVADRLLLFSEHRTYAKWAFVPDPQFKGRYIRTHRCVLEIACPICSSEVGRPCLGIEGFTASVCATRKDLFYGRIDEEAAEELGKVAKKVRSV